MRKPFSHLATILLTLLLMVVAIANTVIVITAFKLVNALLAKRKVALSTSEHHKPDKKEDE